MEYWRGTIVAALAREPQEWRPLGQLFIDVADVIPMHLALRRAATRERQARRRAGDDREVQASELDFVKAQWQLFLSFVLPLVERQSPGRRGARHDALVRLKPSSDPCEKCDGPTYLTEYGGRNTPHTYGCPRCTEEPAPAATPIVETPISPEPAAPPRLIIVPPPPRREKPFNELGFSLSSLKEIWDEFAWAQSNSKLGLPRFEDNRKLHRTLHRALEAGAARQYQRLSEAIVDEYRMLKLHQTRDLETVLHALFEINCRRSLDWLNEKTPNLTRDDRLRWCDLVTRAYHYGSAAVLALTLSGRMMTIRSEMEALLKTLAPAKPGRVKTVRQRWMTPLKNTFRWRVR